MDVIRGNCAKGRTVEWMRHSLPTLMRGGCLSIYKTAMDPINMKWISFLEGRFGYRHAKIERNVPNFINVRNLLEKSLMENKGVGQES